MRRGRISGLFALVATALMVGSAAFACTNLATINLSSSTGRPGDAITVTGTGFLANADEMPMDGMVMDMSSMPAMTGVPLRSPVTLRWNAPDSPVLSEAVPDRSGTISVIFDVPDTQAGQYTLVAVQKNPHGYDVYGTPARAPFQVIGSGRPGSGAVGAGAEGGSGQSTSPGLLALTVGLGVLGAGLLAAGGVVATRMARVRRAVPAEVAGRD